MAKDLKNILLFDFYRNILPEKQAEIIDLYYNEDLSLSEISEHLGITRQGVRDNIQRAERKMTSAEEDLALAARYEKCRGLIAEIRKETGGISEKDIAARIDKLLTEVENFGF